MSKNFEEEYRQMMDSEIPDLWERIDARIEARSAEEEAEPAKKASVVRFFNRRRTAAAITAAAAVLCILAARPIYFRYGDIVKNDAVMSVPAENDFWSHVSNSVVQGVAPEGNKAPQKAEEERVDFAEVAEAPDAMDSSPEGNKNFAGIQEVAENRNPADTQAPMEAGRYEEADGVLPDFFAAEVQILDLFRDGDGRIVYEVQVLSGTDGSTAVGPGLLPGMNGSTAGESGILPGADGSTAVGPGLLPGMNGSTAGESGILSGTDGSTANKGDILLSESGERVVLHVRFAGYGEEGEPEPEEPLAPGQRCNMSLYSLREPSETGSDLTIPTICVIYRLEDIVFDGAR